MIFDLNNVNLRPIDKNKKQKNCELIFKGRKLFSVKVEKGKGCYQRKNFAKRKLVIL